MTLIDILLVFVAISVLVLIHELGHFLMAKYFGVWVEEFGLGLPPRIFGKKIGETLYSINLLPIGGFVKLHGEEEQTYQESTIKKPKHTFIKKPWWQKALIIGSGVVMNFILALVIITVLFVRGVPVPDRVAIEKISDNSPASMAGFNQGDVIKKINNQNVVDVNEVIKIIKLNLEKETVFIVERETNNKTSEITLKVIPRKNPPPGEGALGVVLSQKIATKKYPIYLAPFYGLKYSLEISYNLAIGIVGVFWDMFSALKVPKDVAGPIGIVQLYKEARKVGLTAILELTGLISLNLAIINLFPIPPMDGARLLFVILERTTGKKLNQNLEQTIYKISFLFLILLFILISIQDISRLFAK